MNKDKLNSPDSGMVARGTFVLLDLVDQFPDENRVLCPAVLLLTLCEAYEVNPNDVLQVANNWIADKRNEHDTRMKAMDYYIQRNILRK